MWRDEKVSVPKPGGVHNNVSMGSKGGLKFSKRAENTNKCEVLFKPAETDTNSFALQVCYNLVSLLPDNKELLHL